MELDELMGAGLAKGLIKKFNKKGVKASLFVIFTTGGIDFVGGYKFYEFLKYNIFDGDRIIHMTLRKITEDCRDMNVTHGEEVYKRLFEDKILETPAYWKQII